MGRLERHQQVGRLVLPEGTRSTSLAWLFELLDIVALDAAVLNEREPRLQLHSPLAPNLILPATVSKVADRIAAASLPSSNELAELIAASRICISA